MKNTLGTNVSVTLFGESHGDSIGAVIDGLAAGIKIDEDFIRAQLTLRRPVGKISTARQEIDPFKIVSGVFEGRTTGAPLCIVIPNGDTRSKDYSELSTKARPSHADYTAFIKYCGFEDYRGGGHFSGRITAALVAAGAVVIPALRAKGIFIGTHIKRCAGIPDRDFENLTNDITELSDKQFAVLDDAAGEKMIAAIESAANDGDSVGGVLETAITGLDAGLGEPWFDSTEGLISKAIFSIPAIKGIEFGAGFAIADMKGSTANDPFAIKSGKTVTETNNSGGINGGITNGMPIIFRTAVRPTPTVSKTQNTIDFKKHTETTLSVSGRHDPCIVHRARIVVDSVTALVICDMLSTRYGNDWI